MKSLNIVSLLTNLIKKAPKIDPSERQELEKEETKKQATIRLPPSTKKFYDMQADNLGVSLQEILVMTLRSVEVATDNPVKSDLMVMVERFFKLFEDAHVATRSIPYFLPENSIRPSDLADQAKVIDMLDGPMLDYLSELFLVDRTYLENSTDDFKRYNGNFWYKDPRGLFKQLAFQRSLFSDPIVYFVARKPSSFSFSSASYFQYLGEVVNADHPDSNELESLDMGIVIALTKDVNEHRIKINQVWEQQRWNYHKCRDDLETILAFCEKGRIKYDGLVLGDEDFSDLFYGQRNPAEILNQRNESLDMLGLTFQDDRNPINSEMATAFNRVDRKYADYLRAVRSPASVESWDDFELTGQFKFIGDD